MISDNTFRLFADLEANNSKAWFDAHRDEIHQHAVLPLTAALEAASVKLAKTDLPMKGGAKTLFRMHRDIRFAKNKAPYKTQVSGLLTPDGSKLAADGVAYLQLDQHGGHMSAGYYNIDLDTLKRIREKIAAQPDAFKAVVHDLKKAGLELTQEQTLTGMPKGYSQYAGEWFAPYLKLKVFLVRTRLTREVWTSGQIVPRFVNQTLKCSSLIRFGQTG